MKMSSRVFRASQLPADLASEWSRLLLASPAPTAFLSPGYSAVADQVLGGTYVCVLESAGEPQAFFPFAKQTRLAQMIGAGRPVASELTDYVGVVCRPGFQIDARNLIRRAGIHSFLFTHLDASQLVIGLTGEQPRIGLSANLAGGFERYRVEIEANNKAVRAREARLRRLERDHGATTFCFDQPYDAVKLDQLVRQKSEQYVRTNALNPLESPASKQFLHAIARAAPSKTCTAVLSTLHSGDTILASHLGLRCGQTWHYWFPVYNLAFGAFSPGRILMWEMIRSASEAGITTVDFGEGDTPAKRRFANRSHTYYRGFYTRRTLQGFCDRAVMALRWRL